VTYVNRAVLPRSNCLEKINGSRERRVPLHSGLPKGKLYGLTSQLRRAAVSIPSNIAEGQGRFSKGEFKQFLGHARGSLLELETQILIAQQLGYLPTERIQILLDGAAETGRILNGLLASLDRRP
jgi:four helix bundle protein